MKELLKQFVQKLIDMLKSFVFKKIDDSNYSFMTREERIAERNAEAVAAVKAKAKDES